MTASLFGILPCSDCGRVGPHLTRVVVAGGVSVYCADCRPVEKPRFRLYAGFRIRSGDALQGAGQDPLNPFHPLPSCVEDSR